jgi:thymidylate synthase
MDAKQFSDQTKQFVSDWQKRLEEMQMQFSLGKMDAVDAFEKQKEQYRSMLLTFKENIDKGTGMAEEKAAEMKAKIEELRLQLTLGKAEGMDAFEEQRKKIELAMHELYIANKGNLDAAYNKSLTLFDHNAEAFKTGLEIVKLQFSLAKMDAKDTMEEKQKEIGEKMTELNQQFKTIQSAAIDNIDDMNRQLRENFEKMRAYAEGWMKK